MIPKHFFQYFRECYQLDYKEFSIDNFFSTKYKNKWVNDKKEVLLTGELPKLPYHNSKIDELQKSIELHKLETQFFYTSFYILGKTENAFVKDKRICAPLLLFPAKLIKEGDLDYITIDIEDVMVNRKIISRFQLINKEKNHEEFIQLLIDNIVLYHDDAFWLQKLINDFYENVQTNELTLYPELIGKRKLSQKATEAVENENQFRMVSASSTLLLSKSSSSLQVLQDLEMMANKNSFNTSLNELLLGEVRQKKEETTLLDAQLNLEQLTALQNSHKYHNSVVVGPPGTGKTYTLTAIVIDAILKKKSVLVVSQSKQAIHVINEMLKVHYQIDKMLVNATSRNYKKSLLSKVKKILSGIRSSHKSEQIQQIKQLRDKINLLEMRYQRFVDKEVTYNKINAQNKIGIVDIFKKWHISMIYKLNAKVWKMFVELNQLNKKLEESILLEIKKQLNLNFESSLKKNRRPLSIYYDALESSSFTAYKELIKDLNFQQVLSLFPVWLVNLSELNNIVPLQKDLFDLVVIDEATQCNIAAALPAIYRAKHTVITGDPNQLKHYSFVSTLQQQKLQEKYQLPTNKILDYRNRSILDVFIANIQFQDQITFLKEHYRSSPSIIQFSNDHFYENQLLIMKSEPKYTRFSQNELIYVVQGRCSDGVNEKEAFSIINKLDELILTYNKQTEVPSVGVLSFLSAQSKYISSLIKKKYDTQIIKKFSLIVGNPYQFQGTEREIMLLSLSVSEDSHHSTFQYVNKPEVLNVAITRAKSKQYVFTSLNQNRVGGDTLLEKYIHHLNTFKYNLNKKESADEFQIMVKKALNDNGIVDVYLSYPIAGMVLDLYLEYGNKGYFIDLLGYEGDFSLAFSFERYKALKRIGITCFPLHYSFWVKSEEIVMNQLFEVLNNKK